METGLGFNVVIDGKMTMLHFLSPLNNRDVEKELLEVNKGLLEYDETKSEDIKRLFVETIMFAKLILPRILEAENNEEELKNHMQYMFEHMFRIYDNGERFYDRANFRNATRVGCYVAEILKDNDRLYKLPLLDQFIARIMRCCLYVKSETMQLDKRTFRLKF